ncbi:lysylphosphatidylglycerol synthase domain-containing protein [uncultured Mucilaginibacter sp.]|uniref:lysylphosphatidylglycerol synthase domain-containing protein n=1 Tax=uncultured Mucilaginibacter sp. TaxID=797541 RepID=UPI0026079812|nr:lysylphosphatidylglycerol synthase domain-containing protein [uncultured Mucilaginibacter sp.]
MARIARKTLGYLLKAGILLLTIWFVYRHVNHNKNLEQFVNRIHSVGQNQVYAGLIAVTLLMFLNWVLEAVKWKYLTKLLEKMSLWKSIEAVFCGLTMAIITPNRIGEYGGRILYLPPRKRIHGIFAMAVGAFGQNTVTNVVGTLSLLYLIYTYQHLNFWLSFGITVFGAVFILAFLLLYFRIRWLVFLLDKIKFLQKYHRFFSIMAKYSFPQLTLIMLLSLARFVVFSSQYYILIHILLPDLHLIPVMVMVFNLFFIQSAIPSLDLLDIGVRNFIANYLFGFITTQSVAIMACVSCIWLINLIIPAVIGSVFVLKLNFFGNNT